MSLLTYNDISLPLGITTNFSQQAVRDESSTDRMYTRFEITYQGIINPNYIDVIAPDLASQNIDNPAGIMNGIRTELLRDRRSLSFTINGVDLIPTLSGPGTVDAKNGPQPQQCVISDLGSETFLLTYSIVAHYWEGQDNSLSATPATGPPPSSSDGKNDEQPALSSPVLDNRWSESVTIDSCMMTTRTRDGVFVIRSDNIQGFIADQVRSQFAVVGVPFGFLRKSATYSVSPDGLSIRYNVVDEEVYKKPPEPAFEAEGDYVEESPGYGVIIYGSARCRLRGAKTTNQKKLIEVAITTVMKKLQVRGGALLGTNKPQSIPQGTRLRVDMFRNEVEFSARVRYNMTSKRFAGAVFNLRGLTGTPLSKPQYTPPYLDRGTAGFLLRAATYYDPSLLNNALSSIPQVGIQNTKTKINVESDSQMNNGTEVGLAGQFPE